MYCWRDGAMGRWGEMGVYESGWVRGEGEFYWVVGWKWGGWERDLEVVVLGAGWDDERKTGEKKWGKEGGRRREVSKSGEEVG